MLRKSLYLIDISSFIFRAYYAIRALSTKDGTPVNAVFGVISMLNKLIKDRKPDHMIVCNDRPDKGIRHEIYPEYKANRDEPPDDLVPQFDLVKEFIQAFPIKAVDKKGYEADDIIATLTRKYQKQNDIEIYIVSGDKDLMQLVTDNVFLYDTMKNKIYKPKDVEEKWGVPPEKVLEMQSLCGDATDNIPGITGVGPKTAAKLLKEYGSLDDVLKNASSIKGKLGEKVQNGKEDALLSKKLVTLYSDIDLDLDWDRLELHVPDIPKLNRFYKKLDFKRFIVEDGAEKEKGSSPSKVKYVLVNTIIQLVKMTSEIQKKKIELLSFDTETDSIDSLQANLVGMSLCFEKNKAYYLPLGHHSGQNLSLKHVKEHLGPILSDQKIAKVAQNAKFDINVLSQYDIEISPLTDDTMIASYLSNPSEQHGLDFLADKHLGHQNIKFSDVVPKGKTFADVDMEDASHYAAEDAWATFSILKPLQEELKEAELTKIYTELEIPLMTVLARMEQNGVLIDEKFLNELDSEFTDRLNKLEGKIYKLAGEEFNINSPKQLGVILFEKLDLPVIKKTKTGFSTDVDVLTKLAKMHELPDQLLQYRSLTKLLSTYVIQLKNLINHNTGRVHTSFNQTIAATGRLSSTDPNLQNIPIKTEEGRRIREAFIVSEGCDMYSFDYSQVELRLLAAFSKDPHLMEAYEKDEDIHAKTASKILGIDLDAIDASERAIGKTINFGVVYGQTPYGLSQQLKVPQSEAKIFIESFYKEFSHVLDYKEKILEQARKDGYVKTYLGRRRYLPDLNAKNKMAKQNAERVAFNTVFQGSAADLIKKAMIEIQSQLDTLKLKTKMILQVHDELIFEVPKNEKDKIREMVTKIMESAFDLDVPIKVSSDFGKNWAEAH